MNELEEVLMSGSLETIDAYLGDVKPADFRLHIQQMLRKAQSPDIAALKQKIKDTIDTL